MGKKIKVVDIVPEETTTQQTERVEDVITPTVEDVEEVIPNSPVEESVVDVLVETAPAPKQRAKQTGRRSKKDVVELSPEVQPEVVQEVETVKEEPKTEKVKKVVEQVKCPKCDKMMSQKSLRYTHEQNCKGEVVKTEDLPVKRRTTKNVEVKPEPKVKPTVNKKEMYDRIVSKNVNLSSSEVEIPDDLKHEIMKTIQRQQTRLKMKEDNLNRLKMQIV